jgi:enoyl-CoA hydratase/carnithine racemase
VVPAEDLLSEARSIASQILKAGPVALGHAKDCINKSDELELSAGIAYERSKFGLSFTTYDRREGMDAFAQKRAAEFKGR